MIITDRLVQEVGKLIVFHQGGEIQKRDEEHIRVMLEALAKYKERQARYDDLWARAGARDNAHHCRSKALRVETELNLVGGPPSGTDGIIDDGLDLVNYAVFTVRNVRAGRIAGPTYES